MTETQYDLEYEELFSMSGDADPVLADLWNNEKDSAYDQSQIRSNFNPRFPDSRENLKHVLAVYTNLMRI